MSRFSTNFPKTVPTASKNHLKGGLSTERISTIATTNAQPLAAPYKHRIGKVCFEVSSLGNPHASDTAQQLILRMLEGKITQIHKEKELEENIT